MVKKKNIYQKLPDSDNTPDNTILKRINEYKEFETKKDIITGKEIKTLKFTGKKLKTDLNTELKTLKSHYIKLDDQVSSKNLEELRNKKSDEKINQEFKQTKKGLKKKNTTRTVSVNEAVKDTLEGNEEINLAVVRQDNFNMNDWKDNLIVNVGNFSDLKKKTVKLLEKIQLDKAKLDYINN